MLIKEGAKPMKQIEENEDYIDRQIEKVQCYYCDKKCEEWSEENPNKDVSDDDYLKCEHCNIGVNCYKCNDCEYMSECEDYNIEIIEDDDLDNEAFYENCVIGCGYNSVEEFWEHSI